MKQLAVVAWFSLVPPVLGGAVRARSLYPRLSDWHVRLAAPGEPCPDLDAFSLPCHPLSRLPWPWSPRVFNLWGRRAAQAAVAGFRQSPPDVVLGDGVWSAWAARRVADAYHAPLILAVHSIEHLSSRGAGRHPLLRTLARSYERDAYRCADAFLCFSQADADIVGELGFTDRSREVIGAGADVAALSRPGSNLRAAWGIGAGERIVLFHGKLNYPPNRDALDWLAREIAPRVSAGCPGVRFVVTGSGAPRAEMPPLEFVGFVDDLADALRSADVCVAPIRDGTGMRTKVIECLAAERPVVTTTVGDIGIGTRDGIHLLRRDDGADFAEAIVELLSDPARGRRLAEAGRRYVASHYDWSVLARRLEDVLASWVGRGSIYVRYPASRDEPW